MNLENIRELRTAHGEAEINELLSSGKWRVLNLVYEDEGIVASQGQSIKAARGGEAFKEVNQIDRR